MSRQKKLQAPIVLTVLCSLAWGATTASASTGQCAGLPLRTITQTMERLTGRLKIANYRGHLEKMTTAAMEMHYWIDSCSQKDVYLESFGCIPTGDQAAGTNPGGDDRQHETTIGAICDFECHVELARYHVFMSGDFIYASDAIHTDPERLQKLMDLAKSHADLCGVPLVERAMRLLSNQGNKCVEVKGDNEGVQDKCDGNDEDAETAFEEIIRKSAALNALKVRLLLASGDLSYQASSDLALKKIMSIVEAALGEDTESPDNTIEMAYARYENALWTCIEALTDIPNMQRFDDIRRMIGALREESKKRLESIQNGMLFLNIDPDFYVNMSASEYEAKLISLKNRITTIEDKIQTLQVAGLNIYAEEEQQGITEARSISNLEVSLNAEKIGRLHDQLAQEQNNFDRDLLDIDQQRLEIENLIADENLDVAEIEEVIANLNGTIGNLDRDVAVLEMDKLAAEGDILGAQKLIAELEKNRTINLFQRDTLEYKKRIRQMQLDLDERKLDMEFKMRSINSMEERDLLGLRRQNLKEAQTKYQWLINHEITKMNLDLNLRSMATQILEQSKTIEQAKRSVDSLHVNGRIKHMEYNTYESDLKELELKVKAAFFSRYIQHVFNRLSTRTQICAIESQLRYLGASADPANGYQLGQDSSNFFYATYRPFAANGYGTYTFPSEPIISSEDRADPSGERIPVPQDDGFEYILFQSDSYSQQCIGSHEDLFSEVELTSDDIQDLNASDYRLVDNFPAKTTNPIEDLALADGMLDEVVPGDDLNTPRMLLNQSNKPCNPLDGLSIPLDVDAFRSALCEQSVNENGEIVDGIQHMIINNQIDINEFMSTCMYQESMSGAEIENCKAKLGNGLVEIDGQTKTYYQLVLDSHEKNMGVMDAQITKAENAVRNLRHLVDWLDPALNDLFWTRVALESTATAAAAAAMAMAGVPKSVVTVFGGVVVDIAKTFETIFQVTIDLADFVVANIESKIAIEEKLDELRIRISDVVDLWEQLKKEKVAQEMANRLTLVELRGKYESLQSERAELFWKKQQIQMDCQKGRLDWIEQVDGLLMEHRRLVNDLNGQGAAISQVDNQIQQYKIQADKNLYRQEIIRAEIDGMNLQIYGLRDDSVTTARIVENTVQQMCMTDNMRNRVADLEEELDGVEDAIALIDEAIEANLINTNQIERDKLAAIIEQAAYSTQELTNLNLETMDLLEANLSDSLGIWSLQSKIHGLQEQMHRINVKIQASEVATHEQKQQILDLNEQLAQSNTKIRALSNDDVELRGDTIDKKIELNELQKGYHHQILNLRDQIVDNIEEVITDTEGKRKQIFFNTQQAIASVNMGIPEYIAAKKKLLERANYYLNGMRSRIKRLYMLNSDAGNVDTSLGYLKTANQLGEQIDYYTDKIWELAAIPAIMGNNTTVQLPATSGLVRELLLKKKVRFEVAPIPGDDQTQIDQTMEANGYYTIWNKNFEVPNARLIDVAMSGGFACDGMNTVSVGIRHLGSGYVFMPINRTSDKYGAHMIVSNEMINPSAILWEELDDAQTSQWNQFKPVWQTMGSNSDLMSFESDLKEKEVMSAPVISGQFIGLPLAGVFEVMLHENANCPIDGKDLSIHFKFTRDQKYSFEHID